MFSSVTLSVLLGTLLIIATIPDAASYSKYGRTCKDIGCPSDQVCVMAEDPCAGYGDDKCGRYPTCQKTSDTSCTSMVCGVNEYCKSENGAPRCVRKSAGSAPFPGLNRVSYRTTPRVPTPPPRSSSYDAMRHGNSGFRNSIGNSLTYDRLFGNRPRSRPSSDTSSGRSNTQTGGNGYYTTHTRVDSHGNRVWTFSG